jgi:GTP-binding protein
MNFTVAIVGKPNVGKSTLFNRIIGKRISIIHDKPGVTRDRVHEEAEWNGKKFTLIDTGGIEPNKKDFLVDQIKRQVNFAIETADLILFIVDGKEGLTSTDKEVADQLRKCGKPVILVINKVDNFDRLSGNYEFFELGFQDVISVSAVHGLAIGDLLDKITGLMENHVFNEEDEDVIKIAVVGKPNVGKSSLINSVLGEERVIVSDMPGTTRDAIDTPFEAEGHKMVFIDTAGMRRKSRVTEDVEFYSNIRAVAAIERADVVLFVIDATSKISEQDKRIAGMAHDRGKASIIIVNKWDLVEKDSSTAAHFKKTVQEEFAFMPYAPVVFVSAKTGKRVKKILEIVNFVMKQYTLRTDQKALKLLLLESTAFVEPPTIKGKKLKIYGIKQSSIKPPTFVLFVNDTKLLHFSYKRFLENKFRETFGFEGTPIIIKGIQKEASR